MNRSNHNLTKLKYLGTLSLGIGCVGLWCIVLSFITDSDDLMSASLYPLAIGAIGYCVADGLISRGNRPQL